MTRRSPDWSWRVPPAAGKAWGQPRPGGKPAPEGPGLAAAVGGGETDLDREPQATAPRRTRPGGGETILVADDGGCVRTVVRRLLEYFGYAVVTTENGLEALAIYREKRHLVRVVITDMRMPLLGGAELIRELQAID